MDTESITLILGIAAALLLVIAAIFWYVWSWNQKVKQKEQEEFEAAPRQASEDDDLPPAPDRVFEYEIGVSDEGFSFNYLLDQEEAYFYEWDWVIQADAYKRDIQGTESICINFWFHEGSNIELNQHMKGWQHLCGKLSKYLPGVPVWGEWYSRFSGKTVHQSDDTTLFLRKAGESPADAAEE